MLFILKVSLLNLKSYAVDFSRIDALQCLTFGYHFCKWFISFADFAEIIEPVELKSIVNGLLDKMTRKHVNGV